MKIGICDDSHFDRKMVFDWITENYPLISKNNIYQFVSGESLLEYIRFNLLDIIFLDNKMEGMDGLKTSEKIKINNGNVFIILLTEFLISVESCYDADIDYFIFKKNFYKKIDSAINKFLYKYNTFNKDIFTVKTNKGIANLPISEIVFIESELRKKNIYLIDKSKYSINRTMDEIGNYFEPKGFIRPHKSYLVNTNFIQSIKRNEIITPLHHYIPVSKSKYSEIINYIMDNNV